MGVNMDPILKSGRINDRRSYWYLGYNQFLMQDFSFHRQKNVFHTLPLRFKEFICSQVVQGKQLFL